MGPSRRTNVQKNEIRIGITAYRGFLAIVRLRLLRIEPGITCRGDGRDKKQDTSVDERRMPDGSPGGGRRLPRPEDVRYPPDHGDD